MRNAMSCKQYEARLDEQFSINGRTFVVALFPHGWNAMDTATNLFVCKGAPTKAQAIKEVEEATGGTYDPATTKYL